MTKIIVGRYAGTIYPEADGYTGAISLGFDAAGKRRRVKRKARSKAAVKDKLVKAVDDLESGLETTGSYTVADAVNDWLAKGLKGRDPSTVTTYRILAEQHVIPLIGAVKLKDLSADAVDHWLDGLTGKLADDSLRKVHSILRRAAGQAQARNRVFRNVAGLVKTPKGTAGRPSRALTLDQATAVLEQARTSSLHAYVVVALLTGIRTEESRALTWDQIVAIDQDQFAICVWRSVRAGGDTKTPKSRRTLELPEEAVTALRQLRERQERQRQAAGSAWHDNNLVFSTGVGTPLAAGNVRRSFRAITTAAGIGPDWAPRELRHSFVSIMSDNGVSTQTIADLVGHKSTAVTERVYRHQLRPVITRGAEAMNSIFNQRLATGSPIGSRRSIRAPKPSPNPI